MLTVETICKVRLLLARGESMRQVAKKYRMSRNTVKKVSTSEATVFKYAKRKPKYPMFGAYIERLEAIAKAESELPLQKTPTTGPFEAQSFFICVFAGDICAT